MDSVKRRGFLKKAAVASAATAVGGATVLGAFKGAPAVHAQKTYQMKMVTTWGPHFPVLGEGADLFAQWVDEMSDGRIQIQVYGSGELVPAMESFDAVSQGIVEMGHAASYYWAGKSAATQFFTTVPFGMNAQQANAWLYSGGGLQLWEEVYADFNLVPFPAGNTGVQMGGWFNREIASIEDIKGLKMRMPGLGGKVIDKAGAAVTLSPAGEIYTNLERGVIDATEWVGPYHDYLLGLHKVAKYYYYPGWHEPGSVLEIFVNKGVFEKLPTDLQHIIRAATYRSNIWMLSAFEAQNNVYLQTLINEHNVQLKRFPDDVLQTFKKYTKEVLDELTAKDPMSKKVYESYNAFRRQVAAWGETSEKAYYSYIA